MPPPRTNRELGWWDAAKARAIESACSEMMEGRLDGHVVVDAVQGGAGTSTNMNVNTGKTVRRIVEERKTMAPEKFDALMPVCWHMVKRAQWVALVEKRRDPPSGRSLADAQDSGRPLPRRPRPGHRILDACRAAGPT
jgi:hypothetical protein